MLTKTDYSEWTSPTVYVKNKIRAYVDFPTGLNGCLETYTNPLLSSEDIFAKVSGGKVFSKLDLSDVYFQISVDEERVKYLTINMKRSNRLPFGIKVARVIFWQNLDTLLNDVDFAIAYLDDILIKTECREQHTEHVKEVFEKIKHYGLKRSLNDFDFFKSKTKYLGQIKDAPLNGWKRSETAITQECRKQY